MNENITERKVLAVPSSGGNDMPLDGGTDFDVNADVDDDMVMDDPGMGDDNMNMAKDMDMGGEDNPFDTNFDAGVEADEDEDPQKYIQQLTGKLSQSLQSYEESLPQPNSGDAKYVGAMILSQVAKYMSGKDFNEMVKSAQEKAGGENGDNADGSSMEDVDDDMSDSDGDMELNESDKKHISEILNKMAGRDEEPTKNVPLKQTGEVGYVRSGYTPKQFTK